MRIVEKYELNDEVDTCVVTSCQNKATMLVDFNYKSGGLQLRCNDHPPMEVNKGR